MKGMKKLLSILMVLTLVLSLGAMAFAAPAADNVTVTAAPTNDKIEHEYYVYQIFTGTQASDSGAKLASVEWGADVNSDFLDKLTTDSTLSASFADCKTAADVAKVLSENTGLADAFAQFAASNVKLEPTAKVYSNPDTESGHKSTAAVVTGYYLIVDKTDVNDQNTAKNKTMLQVTTDVKITNKYDVPSSQKKVKEMNDTTGIESSWQDAADYDIGNDVPFQLQATLPKGTTDNFTTYELTFHDKQSAGLTFNEGSVVVKVGTQTLNMGTDYTIKTSDFDDDCTFEIVIADVKTLTGFDSNNAAGNTITVEYTAKLNENAKIGSEGNTNQSQITFSNNPYNSTEKGRTPLDTVIVFTFDTIVNKVQPDGASTKPLEGAGFTLLKKVPAGTSKTFHSGTSYEVTYNNIEIIKEYEVKPGQTTFDFTGLDSGEYILVESTVPAGYNKADDIEFTVKGTYAQNSDEAHKTEAPTLTSLEVQDKDGHKIEDDTFKVTMTLAPGTTKGTITTDVVNQQGVTLPETGGIGTTIFYVAGAILVAGAVILLVTKKRVSGTEK